MPDTASHLARVRQNQDFIKLFNLDTTKYLDWVVTAYFYSAVHLVEALLFHREGINSELHSDRRSYIRKKSYLWDIDSPFERLKDHSEDARYRLTTMNRPKLENRIIPLYEKVEQHITPQLSK